MLKPYWTNGVATLYHADAREIPLPDRSAHCCVTSPPYFGLRKYEGNDERGIGLETSIDTYLDSLMKVFGEVWRVLREDGILWVNIADSYGGSSKGQNGDGSKNLRVGDKQATSRGTLTGGLPANSHSQEPGTRDNHGGCLLMVPERFAMRMVDAGWILRDRVIWAKDAPMPESVSGTYWEQHRVKVEKAKHTTGQADMGKVEMRKAVSIAIHSTERAKWIDCPGCPVCSPNDGLMLHEGSWRCTRSFEYIFMFVKRMNYWSDGEAIKLPSTGQTGKAANFRRASKEQLMPGQGYTNHREAREDAFDSGTANRRNVWRDIRPEPYKGQHFATFPPDLPRLCIQAGTSEAGACPHCGRQWARVIEHKNMVIKRSNHQAESGIRIMASGTMESPSETRTLSWRPACRCPGHKPVPPMVLDPFAGSCTTAVAAQRLGRRSVMVDLSESYLAQGTARLLAEPLPLV